MLIAQRIIIEKTLQIQSETNLIRAEKKLEKMSDLPSVTFEQGSYVTATYEDGKMPSKLCLPRRGPFRVIDHSDNKVHVQNLVTMKDEWIHASLCNQFLYDPNRVDPIGIARRALPDPEFIVEKVLKHKPENFNPKSKKRSIFLYSMERI